MLIRESHMVEQIRREGGKLGSGESGNGTALCLETAPIVEICLQLFGGIILTAVTLFLFFYLLKVLLRRVNVCI